MKLHPRVSQPAVDLVKRFEGFRPRAARTPEGRFTIGYGHVLSPRDSADTADISEPEAEFLLKHDLSVTAEAVEDAILAPVNENQFAALLSFAFNIGVENFKGSSAVRHLNQGAYLQAAAAIELWRRADFNGDALVVDQLVRRRAVEKALFLAPPEGFMPLPSSVLRPSFDHSVIGAAVAWAAARERTAVSRIALEGPHTSADLAVPPGHEGEPAPSAAIAAADALAARLSRILPEDEHHEELEAPATPAAPEALTLESEPAPPEYSAEDLQAPHEAQAESAPAAVEPEAVEPHPVEPARIDPETVEPETTETAAPKPATPVLSFVGEAVAAGAAVAAPLAFTGRTPELSTPAPRPHDTAFDLPAPPVPSFALFAAPSEPPPAPHVETAAHVSAFDGLDFGGAVEPQTHFETAEHAAEPPPFVSADGLAELPVLEAPVSSWRRRFRPEAVAVQPAVAEEAPSPSLFDAPAPIAPAAQTAATPTPAASAFADDFQDAAPRGYDLSDAAPAPAPTPLFERPLFFVILGLVGIALFAGSIFCMMNRASFTCLLIGVVGVLAMAPAAAFFLFRFLGKPVDPTSEEHASLTQIAHAEAAPAASQAAEAHPEAANDSPFDSAWR